MKKITRASLFFKSFTRQICPHLHLYAHMLKSLALEIPKNLHRHLVTQTKGEGYTNSFVIGDDFSFCFILSLKQQGLKVVRKSEEKMAQKSKNNNKRNSDEMYDMGEK